MKLCKICNSKITHNRKRRLCADCLKQESREASKYYYQKKLAKEKKTKPDFCKCGNKIEHKFKRLICMDCIKKENLINYNFKKEIYNKTRRDKRKENKVLDIRFCVICKTEFQTSHAIKCTCNDKCSEIHRRKLSLDNYYSKKVKKSNTK